VVGGLHLALGLVGELYINRSLRLLTARVSRRYQAASLHSHPAKYPLRRDIRIYQYGHPCSGKWSTLRTHRLHTAATIELGILLLTLVGIRRASTHSGESDLSRLLRTQGVAYFVVVFFIQLSTIASGFNSLEIYVHSYLSLKLVNVASTDGGLQSHGYRDPTESLMFGIYRFHSCVGWNHRRAHGVRDFSPSSDTH
jgi:hypothetical protein